MKRTWLKTLGSDSILLFCAYSFIYKQEYRIRLETHGFADQTIQDIDKVKNAYLNNKLDPN